MTVAVIADDLTGAAELASAAADLGFTAEVHTHFDANSDAQVVAVDTDTRTLTPDEGAQRVAEITRNVLRANPKWVYKKTDSVLRGNVRAEVEAMLTVGGFSSALYIPANPSKGRVIRGGVYYVGGVPLAETSFARDSHHPRTTSDILELLWEQSELKRDHISIPDVDDHIQLMKFAEVLDVQTLPAGGVEFFRAVLQHRQGLSAVMPFQHAQARPILFACGSPQACVDGRLEQFQAQQIPLLLMPGDSAALKVWPRVIEQALYIHKRAAVAIGQSSNRDIPSGEFATRLAETVATVLRRGAAATVCVEGGATAAAVLQQLGCTCLIAPATANLPGVATLRSALYAGLTFLVKPGSYPWPDAVFQSDV